MASAEVSSRDAVSPPLGDPLERSVQAALRDLQSLVADFVGLIGPPRPALIEKRRPLGFLHGQQSESEPLPVAPAMA